MNLTISGHHLEITPALRSYVSTKLDRVIRHFDQVVDVRVLLTVENQKEKDKRQPMNRLASILPCRPKCS
jgi:putative sigma-54 modulation protein